MRSTCQLLRPDKLSAQTLTLHTYCTVHTLVDTTYPQWCCHWGDVQVCAALRGVHVVLTPSGSNLAHVLQVGQASTRGRGWGQTIQIERKCLLLSFGSTERCVHSVLNRLLPHRGHTLRCTYIEDLGLHV